MSLKSFETILFFEFLKCQEFGLQYTDKRYTVTLTTPFNFLT